MLSNRPPIRLAGNVNCLSGIDITEAFASSLSAGPGLRLD